jgi:predicted metalloprotease with PDZ domain
VGTGLERTAIDRIYFAPSTGVLLDSPILVGLFRDWRFAADGVPHRIVYLPLPDPKPFDTTAFVGGIEQIVRQAIALFGRAPYRDYTFLFVDGAGGALEHANSVTLGVSSEALAQDLSDQQGEAAHEYVHTWNLVRIRPDGFGEVDYRPARRSRGLWWGEGVTMFYADVLRRRAGLRDFDSTRTAHLQHLIARYLDSPGNSRFSPESVSVVTNGTPPGALGDYSASVHLQGELLGTMLDLIVRDATRGRRSLDDVMRLMMARYSGARSYTSADIETVAAGVCGCAVHEFFERYVRAAHAIDFDRYLHLVGLRTVVTWGQGVEPDGTPTADKRVFAWRPPGESALRLLLSNPASVWGRAGLHTGDRLVSVNGAPLVAMDAFRTRFRALRVGDTVSVVVQRIRSPFVATVVVSQLERPAVRIEEIPGATERQRTLRARWLAASP